MEAHHFGPFSIPAIHHWVPEKLKPWIVLFIVICFQLSGGIYLSAVAEMVGSLALMQEDIMMAGYAQMVGMALTFAIMFRLKFSIKSKTCLLICSSALIVCNFICMYTTSVPLLIFTCFIAGFFRMWATFECNSTIQLWLTPVRDMSVFFSFIFLLVMGMIQISGITTLFISQVMSWEYMHWLVIGVLYFVFCLVLLVFNNKRFMKKLPLYGIDWLGAIIWGCITLCVLFICVYGEHYDWWHSEYIRLATYAGIILLAINLWRSSFIRHPYVSLQVWKQKVLWITIGLYFVFDTLLGASHLFEHLHMEAILGYDALNVASLNWALLAGVVAGAAFTYRFFAVKKWSYRNITIIGFFLVLLYLVINYFTIDYNLPKFMLAVPMFIRSFASTMIGACLLTALTRIPFVIFPQALTVNGLINTCICGVLGSTIVERVFTVLVKKNAMLLSANTDAVSLSATHAPIEAVYGAIQQQAMMVTMKEIYGWLIIFTLIFLWILYLNKSQVKPLKVVHPTYKAIRRMLGRKEEIETLEQVPNP